MASKLKSLTKRKSGAADISPGDAFSPLREEYKPDSTRARFEELAQTYRETHSDQGRVLGKLDDAVQKRESLIQLITMVKGGQLPPTNEIVDLVHKMDFDRMRGHATTFQGKKVIDNLENTTAASVRAFEEINGEDNVQAIVYDLNNMRVKTKDDRKKLAQKSKQTTEESKSIASSAGKDFLVLAGGVGTSAAFRKAVTDLGNLISATVQNKQPKDEDTAPLTDRVRDLVVEVRADRNVQRSLASLSSLFTTTYNKSTSAAKDARDKAKDYVATEDAKDARDHTRDIFTRLGNGYDLTAMFAAISAIGVMYRDNENFGKLADDTKEFGRWAMNVDADKLTSDEFETRSREILERGRHILTEQDSEHFATVSSESKEFMKAVQANPVLVDYKDSMAGLAHSVVGHTDMTGEERREHYRALRQDVMANLPVLMQAIRYVPIPRVAGMNDQLEFAADNIVLDLKHFVPEHISFDSHSEVYPRAAMLKEDKAKRSQQGFRAEQFFYVTITGVNCVAKKVAFYVKKKKGIPRVAEKGIADLVMDGRGMDITMRLRKLHESETPRVPLPAKASEKESLPTSAKAAGKKSSLKQPKKGAAQMRTERMFDIADIKVKLHSLDIRVHENKHAISSKLGLALMMPVAKRLIAKRLAQSLAEYMVSGDRLLSRYSGTAESLVIGSSKRAMSSAVGAVKQGTQKGKTQIGKLKSQTKEKADKAKDKTQDVAEKAKDKTQDVADMPKDEAVAKTEDAIAQAGDKAKGAIEKTEAKADAQTDLNKIIQQHDQRRDSLVDHDNAARTETA
ncbi:hypothetical protein GGF42_007084 [Coemansia sp. RSA 2424]|nr:hypothetical protein GGF42_007084 [Coemansia sp. RSA 2424]